MPHWHLTLSSFRSFIWFAFFLLFYRQKEVAQENDMGYCHSYRILGNNYNKLIISRLPQLWPVPVPGRRSSGRQKTVKGVNDKLFLLNSAWKVMEKGRKQVYYSSKFTQVLSAQALYFSVPSALLCHPPAITWAVTQPCIWTSASGTGGVCLCVPFCLCWVQPEPDSRAAETVPYTEPPSHHLAIQCSTPCFGPGSNVFEDFPLIKSWFSW